MRGLNRTAALALPDEGTGLFVRTGEEFACRLTQRGETGTGPLRAESASERRLIWGPEVDLPEHCEVVVSPVGGDPGDPDAVAYRPRAGTFGAYGRADGSPLLYRACALVRQEEG